jgi:hypothetical protein
MNNGTYVNLAGCQEVWLHECISEMEVWPHECTNEAVSHLQPLAMPWKSTHTKPSVWSGLSDMPSLEENCSQQWAFHNHTNPRLLSMASNSCTKWPLIPNFILRGHYYSLSILSSGLFWTLSIFPGEDRWPEERPFFLIIQEMSTIYGLWITCGTLTFHSIRNNSLI